MSSATVAETIPLTAPRTFTATKLMAAKLPEPRWAVPGILAQGCTILGGRPKTGKSWMALGLGVAVASGGRALGQIPVQQGEVLYLALEDTMRRLQSRMEMMLEGQPAPNGLTLAVDWPRLDSGGADWLQTWLKSHTESRLVIVDTLARIRSRSTSNGNLYEADYHAVSMLKRIADNAGASLLVIHHLRKMSSEDPLESLSGTMGLSGAADSILVLKKERTKRDATLFMTGRDIDETEINLRFDSVSATWSLLGQSLSDERQAVVAALASHGGMTARDLAATLNRPYSNTRALAWKMANAGQIASLSGLYTANTDNSSNSGNSGNSDDSQLLPVLSV